MGKILCRWFGKHTGGVVQTGRVEVTGKKNHEPLVLKPLPIRQCDHCTEAFVADSDLGMTA